LIDEIVYAEVSVGFDRIEDLDEALLGALFIGAHAAVAGIPLLTRDPVRVRSVYPKLRIIES
jgi:hypothetical protein